MRYKDITGIKYGRLTPIEFVGYTPKNKHGSRHALWKCKCECGNYVIRSTDVITRGKSSCGCIQEENLKKMAKINTTHDASHSSLYGSYKGMMSRCYNPKDIHFKAYGDRGITVCDEWYGHPEEFVKWARENGWQEHLTIERKDNDKGYCPENCCWIPKDLQSKNKRQNIMITYQGQTMCCADWGKTFGMSEQKIRRRYKKGWPLPKVFDYKTLSEPFMEDEE